MRPNIGQITLNHQPTPIFTRHIAEISISSLSMLFTCCWQCSLNFTQDSISLAFQCAVVSFPETPSRNTHNNLLPICSCTNTLVCAFVHVLYSSTHYTTAGSWVNFLLCDWPSIVWEWYTDPGSFMTSLAELCVWLSVTNKSIKMEIYRVLHDQNSL